MYNNGYISKSVPQKLDDSILENISGGQSDMAFKVSCGTLVASLIAMMGCSIASPIFATKAKKAMAKGNKDAYTRYNKIKNACAISMIPFIPVAFISEFVMMSNSSGRSSNVPFNTYWQNWMASHNLNNNNNPLGSSGSSYSSTPTASNDVVDGINN